MIAEHAEQRSSIHLLLSIIYFMKCVKQRVDKVVADMGALSSMYRAILGPSSMKAEEAADMAMAMTRGVYETPIVLMSKHYCENI